MDPGVAKSELLRQVAKISSRGIYTNAKSSSAAGLTVTVTKDEIDGRWTAEAGAACLADLGLCAVDELNLLHKNEQASLHEVLEQQTVSVAKAGLIISLNARTAFLMALNPKLGRLDMFCDDGKPLADQIDISAPLLSRFDLIFLKSDTPEKEFDMQLAQHISNNRLLSAKRKNKTITEDEEKSTSPPLTPAFLRKYFAYAKMQPSPELSPEAAEILNNYYVTERGKADKGTIPLTARSHEAAHRMAEASARLRLSKTVTKKDAEIAITLLQISYMQVATDPKTGKVNLDMIAGTPKRNRDLARTIMDTIGEMTLETGQCRSGDLYQKLREKKIEFADVDFDRILEKLKQTGDLMDNRGYLKIMQEKR
jgi:replicative DNA helicase Mcm